MCKYVITACKKVKYFSIIFDITSDAAHVEQMSQIIRFVESKRNSVDIKAPLIDISSTFLQWIIMIFFSEYFIYQK